MVGAVRFELTTSCTRNKRATRLRYAPNPGHILSPSGVGESTMILGYEMNTWSCSKSPADGSGPFQSSPSACVHPQLLFLSRANHLNRHGILLNRQTTHQDIRFTEWNFHLVIHFKIPVVDHGHRTRR